MLIQWKNNAYKNKTIYGIPIKCDGGGYRIYWLSKKYLGSITWSSLEELKRTMAVFDNWHFLE